MGKNKRARQAGDKDSSGKAGEPNIVEGTGRAAGVKIGAAMDIVTKAKTGGAIGACVGAVVADIMTRDD
ncbi:hypothetical protein [Actinokineospora terrae]|uniref:Uncharacterized protein n=1 Tax=Actinokineospora terrae TaxID=155974 RepID=A0A1H9TCM9_9PSEU|nr:hypothetical protein [Actinokineospora terrae]SER94549.1 hypothetical protein SAMN04487818_106178 [Actinokineospora terrae]